MTVVLGEDAAQLVEGLKDPSKQVQGAGIELTAKWFRSFNTGGALGFDNANRSLPDTTQIPYDLDGKVVLSQGAYLVDLNEIVEIPRDKVAIAVPRSSLLRMGVTLGTALWDPGYKGKGQVLLIVHNPYPVFFYKDVRILQLVYMDLERPSSNLYNGVYQGAGIK
jgi:dUTP pyrophosphatase